MGQWVRSISFPGSTPACGVFFFQDERVQIITHVCPGKKKTATHRGRPREAERTHPLKPRFQLNIQLRLAWPRGCFDHLCVRGQGTFVVHLVRASDERTVTGA